MSSSRLPGKVLLPFGGSTVLQTIIERLSKSNRISNIVIATSVESSDDVLSKYVLDNSLGELFRGSLNDVFSRYKSLSMVAKEDYILRVTGDCPLVCHTLIDTYADKIDKSRVDFASNTHSLGIIKGFDLEFIRRQCFFSQNSEQLTLYDNEHVTPVFYRDTKVSKYLFEQPEARSYKHLNLSIDTEGIYNFLNKLESDFGISTKTYSEILTILRTIIKPDSVNSTN